MPTCGIFGVGSSTSYREQDEGALYLRGLAASGSGKLRTNDPPGAWRSDWNPHL